MTMRKLQIGVMGSAADLKYEANIEEIAEELGSEVAKSGSILFFGAEKDYDSLSTAACRGAKKEGGITVGVTYNKGKNIFQKDADIIISTGLDRGGGRELVLVLSCDVVIAVGGGSGTLTELAIAYQGDIPMIVVNNTGGWSEKLSDVFIDDRKRRKIYGVKTAKEAVKLAVKLGREYLNKYS
ncbi:MAG: TIGR00725 family protein [DPANN group archaeon]|nr:TIGR00725 family protein [DPANN group archaeon]